MLALGAESTQQLNWSRRRDSNPRPRSWLASLAISGSTQSYFR